MCQDQEPQFPKDRMKWFEEARFGMFIHWGLYSILGRGEWAISRERIPMEDYIPLAKQFTASAYDPKQWAQLAKEAGMRYMVLTTKHHEGFCLWDSKICSFNSVNSPAKRDIVGEYVEAARSAGLKVGLYYSLGDWYNQDWFRGWQGDDKARERFMDYTHALVRELMTNYGRIDILFYDLPQCYSTTQWRAIELNAMVRWLQPQILINNRAYTTEDYGTPEQHVSAAKHGRMWESCMTLNKHWGYCPSDKNYKTPAEVAMHLTNAAAGGGNLLLNVGPDPQGAIPAESVSILKEVGGWVRRNGEAIYASKRHNLMWYLFGPVTHKPGALYLHLENYYGSSFVVGGLTNKVTGATLLSTGQKLTFETKGAQLVISGMPSESPDPLHSVVKLEIEGEPDHDISRVINGADIFPDLP